MFAKDIICIIPLSIDTAIFNLEAKAVTKAGQDKSEFNSGNIAEALGSLFFQLNQFCFFQ